jgi:dihydroorotate dehydrogenase
LTNPLGIAAGFDKDGEGIEALHKIGFGFVEIGSVCPDEQRGNEKPRVFRLEEDEAVINRYGFNSKGELGSPLYGDQKFHISISLSGHEFVVPIMRNLRRKLEYQGVIGINMGKNKWADAMQDYPMGVKVFSPTANYLVVNISSPNTPNLRDMQKKENLRELLKSVHEARLLFDEEKQRPIFVKLSPDLTFAELKEVVDVTKRKDCKIDGFIVSNTTIDRDLNLKSKHQAESGGLSGKPLKEKSTKMIEDVYKLTNGKMTIIGVGGVSSGQDAYEKILAGASVVQIYTSFVYHGPPIVTKIKKELSEILVQNGYENVSEAVGKGVKLNRKKFLFW